MASREQVLAGMRKAHEAGDIAAVNEMAAYLDSIPEPEQGTMTESQFQEEYGDAPDVFGQAIEEPAIPEDEKSLGEKALGAGETALSALSGSTLGVIGTIDGTLRGLAQEIASGEFGTQDAAQRIMDKANELASAVTYEPKTETGQEYTQEVGEFGAQLAPLAGLSAPLQQAGQLGRAAAPQVARGARTAAQATKRAASQATEAAKPVADIAKAAFQYQSPTKQKIAKLLESGISDVETAQYKIGTDRAKKSPESPILKALNAGGPKIVKDKLAIEAIDQGFDEGVIASIKGAVPVNKNAMKRMVNIYEKGKKNAYFRAKNRPTDVIGNRLIETIDSVKSANKRAGIAINKASESLKGKYVESQPIGSRFVEALNEAGVKVTDDLKLVFKGSDFEDLPAVERTIGTIFRRMASKQRPDAYELHRMKRFIDEQVSYGKGGEGLTGRADSMLKTLRRDIDSTLDDNFKDYNLANEMYSDTIQALDSIQDVAGKKIDLDGVNANKALGTALRAVLSNNKGRVNVIDSVSEIEKVSRKYPELLLLEGKGGIKKKPDITQLIMFADELDSRFGPTARTSFQGQIEQVVNRGRQSVQSPTMAASDALFGAAARGLDKVKGVSDEKALAAIKKLLNQNQNQN